MNRRITLLLISLVLILSLIIPSSIVSARETEIEDDKLPEELCTKFGEFELDNVLDPQSPNYDPSQRYGPEGTRFGPSREGSKDADILDSGGTRSSHYYYGTYVDPNEDVDRIWARQKISTSLELV